MPAAAVDEAVGRVLTAYGLKGAAVAPLSGGNVNTTWSIDAGGRRWILRRYSTERLPAGIPFEHAVLRGLAAGGWPVPAPLAAPDGSTLVKVEGRFHALFPRLEGSRLDDPARHGVVLARLHRALSTLEVGVRPSWPRLADYGRRPFGDLLAAFAIADPDAAAAVVACHGRVGRALAAAPQIPASIVHGDFHTGNLLFRDGELSGVLDFDFARVDLRAADVAIALAFLPDDASRRSFSTAYGAELPLHPAERGLLPVLRQARELERVSFALRRHRAGEPGQVAEVRSALSRLAALDAAPR